MLIGLTHLRSLAIVVVFLYHYRLFGHPAWIEHASFGWTGVDLFFVLSGFLISRQLFRKFSLRGFYFKRALRILPAYLVVLACYFAWPSIHEREALPPLWRFLTFTQNFALDVGVAGTFSHAWSLCIEEQFYLVLPLVLLGFRKWWLWVSLFCAGFLIRGWCFSHFVDGAIAWYRWIYYPTWARLDGLLVGVAVAALCEFRPSRAAAVLRHGNRLLVVAAAMLAFAWWRFDDAESLAGSVLAFPLIAAAYGVLLLAALSPACILSRFSSRISHWLATLSYALYLVHKACIHVVQARLGLSVDGNAMFACCVVASLAAALFLHLAVERPFLRWRDRVGSSFS